MSDCVFEIPKRKRNVVRSKNKCIVCPYSNENKLSDRKYSSKGKKKDNHRINWKRQMANQQIEKFGFCLGVKAKLINQIFFSYILGFQFM